MSSSPSFGHRRFPIHLSDFLFSFFICFFLYFLIFFFVQEIPPQRPVSGTSLSLQEIIIVGNCEKQVSKTNFMIVKSPRKRDLAVNIKIESVDGTSYLLERKDRVKYLGVLLDESIL